MAMTTRDRKAEEEGLRPIHPVRAWLLKIWGPADAWDNPLVGTKHDPALKQRRDLEKHHERHVHKDEMRRARLEEAMRSLPEHEQQNIPEA
jgi:hypothetical protein